MQSYFLAAHSIIRWVILLFAIWAIVGAFVGMVSQRAFTPAQKRPALFLMIFCDIQLLVGLYLYAANGWWARMGQAGAMKDATTRFYGMEHGVGMIVALILIHIGYAATKKKIADHAKFKRVFWFVLVALIIVIVMIPWPGRPAIGRPAWPTSI